MAKTIGSISKSLSKSEKLVLTYINKKGDCFKITKLPDSKVYCLYKKTKGGYEYLKQRKGDPLFEECDY